MRIAGFSIVRNIVKQDYPAVEAIKSILPLCENIFVAVGNSDDDTLKTIQAIDPHKIIIIETVWDDSLRTGGKVLSIETNKAFDSIPEDFDWCFYIQADEVLHEKYYSQVLQAANRYLNNKRVDGLLFDYLHFYGSYDYIGTSRRWYNKEIRLIRNNKKIRSYKDAQGFRFEDNTKLNVLNSGASIFHYGWVKHPGFQQEKQLNFHKHWHPDDWLDKNVAKGNEFDYSTIDALALFNGTHPLVMQQRINAKNWKFDFDISKNNLSPKEKAITALEKLMGIQIGRYKNYKLLKNL